MMTSVLTTGVSQRGIRFGSGGAKWHSQQRQQGWMSKRNLRNELLSFVVTLMIDDVKLRIEKNDVPSQKIRKKNPAINSFGEAQIIRSS